MNRARARSVGPGLLAGLLSFSPAFAVAVDSQAESTEAESAEAAPPIVAKLQFEGAEYFKPQTLKNMVKQREGAPLDLAQVQADAQTVAQNYRERGFLKARVRGEHRTQLGQAWVTYRIAPGPRAKVRRLRVQGNRALSDAEALEGLFTKPDEFFGVFKQAGVFHAKRLERDLQQVARNYYQHGYLQAQTNGWKAYADPAAVAIDVSIFVREGPLYRVGELQFVGDLPADLAELQTVFGMRAGDIADLVAVSANLERVLDLWREQGHPFPNASQATHLDTAERLLNATFRIDRGPEARVGEIRIAGEPWTTERVIRRELSFASGEPYSLAALRESKKQLLRSGLFTDATLTPLRGSDPGVVDVKIELIERPGIVKDCIFNIAPAYLQYEGLIGIGLLMCPNFMGQGQRFSAIGQLSSLRQLFDLSLVEPRLLDSRVSLVGGVHRRKLVYPLFNSNLLGGELGVTIPLPLDLASSVKLGLDTVDVDPLQGMEAYIDTVRFPRAALRSAVTLRLAHDTRSGGMQASSGSYHAISVETGGPWTLGEISFMELRGQARYYFPLVWGALLKLNFQVATVFDPAGRPVVVNERYFPGGFGSVRGYLPRSLGPSRRFGDPGDPTAEARDLSLGGVSELVGNIEVELPIVAELGIKGFVFLDAGNAFDEDEPFLLWGQWQSARELYLPLGLYSSVGFGLLLPTGVLPIRLEWSVPLTRRPRDRELDFFLGVGGMF